MTAYFIIPILLIIAFLPLWRHHKLWGMGLLVVILSMGGGGYFLVGSPGLPDFPHNSAKEVVARSQTPPVDIEGMVSGLHQRLTEEQSKNGDDWARLAHAYQVLGRMEESLAAWKKVLEYSQNQESLHAMALFRAGGVAHEIGEKKLAYDYLTRLRKYIPEGIEERKSLERLIKEVSE